MDVPKQVRIGPFSYDVVVSRRILDNENADNNTSCRALVRHLDQRIVLTDRCKPERMAEDLLHECLHAILYTYDLTNRTADEHFVEVLTVGLLSFLRSNPGAVEYLREVKNATNEERPEDFSTNEEDIQK